MEILEAWKLANLEVWRLGGSEARKNRFAGLEGLEARESRGLEARRPGGGADDLRENPGNL